MNKIYRVVRNSVTGLWVVASEWAVGCTKSGSVGVFAALAAFAMQPVGAATIALEDLDPKRCDGTACTTTVSQGASVTLIGSGTQIQRGITGNGGAVSLSTLLARGQIVAGQEYADSGNPASLVVNIGTRSQTLVVSDPITGGTRTVSVYDNANIADSFATGLGVNSYSIITNTAVEGQQYVDTRIGQVDRTGGTLNVNLGNGGVSDASGNSINMVAKNSSLFVADGTGSAPSSVVWQSSNKVNMGSVTSAVLGGSTTNTATFAFSAYSGTFTAFDGSSHTVSNAAELRAYNDFLVSRLQTGQLDPASYESQFKRAYSNTSRSITYTNGPADRSDEVYTPIGSRAVIRATGRNASGIIAEGAVLDATAISTNATGTIGAVMLAEQGGTVTNNGSLGSQRGGNGDTQYAMYAAAGSHAINNGVANIGSFIGATGSIEPVNPTLPVGNHLGMIATGSGATVQNNGILNLDGPQSTGMRVTWGATGSNTGIINVNPGTDNITGVGIRSVAVHVANSGAFTNAQGGEIYLGRGNQYDKTAPAGDFDNGITQMVGVHVESSASASNAGHIVLGSRAQGSIGIYDAASTGAVVNTSTGVIDVNGVVEDSPAENIALYSYRSTSAVNAGTINLNGLNGKGLKATTVDQGSGAVSGNARIVNNGTVNVAGDMGATGLRNYGAWAEGVGTRIDIAGGAVNLSGDGAIGVHSRGGANLTVSGGSVNFLSGKDQIGFFAYGAGSSMDINQAPPAGLDVSTQGSTLFRIEDGARINNNANARLIASGDGSTALQVTGAGSTANLDNMNITVSGKGATALKIEGGATGQMSGAATLSLADGTTAVVVDDVKYDLTGAAVDRGDSIFTNLAEVVIGAARDVTGFVVRNGAELINAGDIHVSHGTAIEVVGTGSTISADASGKHGKITVDDGKAGIYVHGGATLTTADDITVDNGASGLLVGADAGRVVVAEAAHITGKGASYGNLITNESAAGNVLVDGAILEMQGSGAALLSQSNLDAASHGRVIVSSQVGGKGIALSNVDGSLGNGSLELGPNWVIDVTGNGAGVYANTTGDLSLVGSRISISGPGIGVLADAANNVTIASGTLITASNADAVLVSGNPATLTNKGTLQAASPDATAIRLGEGDSVFANIGGGRIMGSVELGDGNDSALLEDSVLAGDLLGGAGNDLITVRGNNVTHGVLDGGQGGSDTLVFDAHDYTADAGNADQLRNFEQFELINASRLDLQRDLLLGDNGNGLGSLLIDPTSTLAMTQGSFGLKGNLANAGLITLANGRAGDTLSVDGNYVGNGGTLELDTELGDDDSATDKLVVKGDTSGATLVKINATADSGAYTQQDGIEVVQVGGKSAGDFALSGRVVAGAREYLLVKGGKIDPANGNWYLRSEAPVQPQPAPEPSPQPEPVPTPDPVVTPDPVATPDPVQTLDPVTEPQPEPTSQPEPQSIPVPQPAAKPVVDATPVYRPEVGAYLGNELAALGMFQHTLHDRLGEVDFTERQRTDGNGKDHQAVWTRVVGRGFDSSTGADQVHSSTRTQLMQIGAELGQWTDGDSRTHFGVMAGAGQADTNVSSRLISAKSKGKVDGYSVGAYGTWFADASRPTGLYIDSWMQFGWFDNTVRGDSLSDEHYKSRTLAGSVEAGYALELGQSDQNAWYIEPEAQVIVSRYTADKHVEGNGTEVKVENGSNVTTRVGARVFTRPLDASQKRLQPFVETNWWHNGKAQAMSFNGESQYANQAADVYELKLGAQAELAKGWTTWGHVGGQKARGEQRQTEVQMGIKYSW